jgi:GMP synthase (glutamine-hydrolysing)
MARRALALRHVLFEDLGILEELLAQRGYEVAYADAGVDPFTPDVALAPDLLIVLGGPIGVGDVERYPFLADEIAAVRARLETDAPTLGICLGAQVMAAALGAEVAPTGRMELGFAPLTLTDAGRGTALAELEGVPVLHWHGDRFAIPDGTERLAETPGFPNQGFARGSAALALQFHPEVDPARLERWLIGHAGELADAGVDPRDLRADAAAHGPALVAAGRRMFDRWLAGLPSADPAGGA